MKDIIEKNKIFNNEEVLATLLDVIASGVGSLTNPKKYAHMDETIVVRNVIKVTNPGLHLALFYT